MIVSIPDSVSVTLMRVSSLLSITGAALIIASWWYFRKEMPFFSRKLIACLAGADLLLGATFLWASLIDGARTDDAGDPSDSCIAQGFSLQFTALASIAWTSCFAYHLYQLIVKQCPDPAKYFWRYGIVAWGLPLMGCVFLLFRQLEGDASVGAADRPWCWIATHPVSPSGDGSGSADSGPLAMGELLQLCLYYIPLLVALCVNLVLYVWLWKRVKSMPIRRRLRRRLLLYLLVFVGCTVWGLINRIGQAVSADHQPNELLNRLEAFFAPAQGFLNALVYGVDRRMVSRYRHCMCGGARRRGESAAALLGKPAASFSSSPGPRSAAIAASEVDTQAGSVTSGVREDWDSASEGASERLGSVLSDDAASG